MDQLSEFEELIVDKLRFKTKSKDFAKLGHEFTWDDRTGARSYIMVVTSVTLISLVDMIYEIEATRKEMVK